ncbi:MAG: hypothetical protein AAB909_03005 [Patescibacteria group bacterium]
MDVSEVTEVKEVPDLATKSNDYALHRNFRPSDETETHKKRQWAVPEGWTVLHHGTNLARAEWQGARRDVLNQPSMTVETGYPGMSCITEEDRIGQKKIGRDTTQGFSTIETGDGIGEPAEIRVLIPNWHKRKRGYSEEMRQFATKHGQQMADATAVFNDQTFWINNQQHPVISRGIELVKIDNLVEDGRTVFRYVPRILLDAYDSEVKK